MQNSFWHQIPMVKLLLPFSVGIGISMFYPIGFIAPFLCFGVMFIFAIIVFIALHHYAHRWVFGLLLSIAMFCGGIALHQYQSELRFTNHFRYYPSAKQVLIMVNEQPVSKSTSFKYNCKVLGVTDSIGNIKTVKGTLLVYMQKAGSTCSVKYGDVLLIPYANIQPVTPPQNPDEFNYKRYLAFNNIYFQAYIKEDFFVTNTNNGNWLQQKIYDVQLFVKNVLSSNINSANETAVAQALLYGYDDDINAETVRAYSNTGTLHVLAVSGMHVGIIYMILGLLLMPFDKIKKGKIIKGIIIIVSLWFYSLLCGMSPSILRATVMFSFIIVSGMMQARTNVYNTLAASAFVLLCYNPNMLANVGFQLSYLAVLGIVFFQPLIYKWYTTQTYIGNQIWTITSVSLAAQLITCPIGLLYFHQFPNCFLFSNLLIIPLTSGILYSGIFLVAISPLGWFAWVVGQLLYMLIYVTNTLVLWVERIPYAYINGIHISIAQSIILYGIIGFITAFFLLRKTVYLKLFLSATIVFFVFQVSQKAQNKFQQKMIVYNISHTNAIHFMIGNKAILLADSSFLNNADKMKFHLQQHIWHSGITEQKTVMIDNTWRTITYNKKKIVIAGNTALAPNKIDADILVLTQKIDLESLLPNLNLQKIIIASPIKPAVAQSIRDLVKRKNIFVQYAPEKGAIEVSLLD